MTRLVERLLSCALGACFLGACGDDDGAGGAGGSGAASPSASSAGGATSTSASGGAGAGGGSGECTTALDCPLPASECVIRTCEDSTCGEELGVPGSIVTTQTPGDCLRNVCDTRGGVVAEPDDTDAPDDQNECTVDACDAGVATHAPAANGTPCAQGTCMQGQCEP